METYDAIVVLGGGIVWRDGRYCPTGYEDADEFGMLGGEMRVIAAALMCDAGRSNTFMFCTGKTQKMLEKFGPTMPTEAEVYSRRFMELCRTRGAGVLIHLEDSSTRTNENLEEAARIITSWKVADWPMSRVAIISSNYHIVRVSELWVANCAKTKVGVDFLSAEVIVTDLAPGAYDRQIERAYASELARARVENETRGLKALASGTYSIQEFQLTKKD